MTHNRPKILYCDLCDLVSISTLWGLIELDYEVVKCDVQSPDAKYEEDDVTAVLRNIKSHDPKLIFSVDFSPAIAEACNRAGRIYLSWVYDSPQQGLYMEEVSYDTNIIFVFDKIQYDRLSEFSIPHLYHHPLAGNISMTSVLDISDDDVSFFASDVSFVGNLYEDANRSSSLTALSEHSVKQLNDYMSESLCNWNGSRDIMNTIPSDAVHELGDKMLKYSNVSENSKKYLLDSETLARIMIARELTMHERLATLSAISNAYNTTLFTDSSEVVQKIPSINIRNRVSYETEMFKVFYSSKINLNITLSTIESGVPQRIFDIMCVGGFVLTNDQSEIHDLFVPDRDLVVFRSIDEMLDKADYYLTHDTERIRIGINGYQKVSEKYTMTHALEDMIHIAREVFDF